MKKNEYIHEADLPTIIDLMIYFAVY